MAGDAPPALYGHAAPFYPVIGLLLGLLLAGLALAAGAAGLTGELGAPASATVLLGVWVWSTGALHLDGLADCADAWVGGLGSRERTLAIMKDPHIGAMGVVALVLVLLAKLAALTVLLRAGPGPGLLALLCTPMLARAQILWLALTLPPARMEGLGAVLGRHLPRGAAWLAAAVATTAALVSLAAAAPPVGVATAMGMGAVLLAWRRSLLHRLGGYTGDGIGALVELTETFLLLGAALGVAAGVPPTVP